VSTRATIGADVIAIAAFSPAAVPPRGLSTTVMRSSAAASRAAAARVLSPLGATATAIRSAPG
jgi:hypothetical protein